MASSRCVGRATLRFSLRSLLEAHHSYALEAKAAELAAELETAQARVEALESGEELRALQVRLEEQHAQAEADRQAALKAADGYKNYAGGLKTLGPIKDEVLAAAVLELRRVVVQPQVLGDDGADEGRHHQQHDLEERLPRNDDVLGAADARELRPRRLRLLALLSVHCATRRDAAA